MVTTEIQLTITSSTNNVDRNSMNAIIKDTINNNNRKTINNEI